MALAFEETPRRRSKQPMPEIGNDNDISLFVVTAKAFLELAPQDRVQFEISLIVNLEQFSVEVRIDEPRLTDVCRRRAHLHPGPFAMLGGGPHASHELFLARLYRRYD